MSVNKVILVGNVGKDPEIKYFDNDNVKANFPLATSERGYTAANGTQVPERTEWHNIVCWRGLAQIVEKFVKKGTQLYIEGKIRSRSYDDQNGVKRYITEIYADNVEMLNRRAGSGEGTGFQNDKHDTSYNDPVDLSDNSEADDLPF
ncbi:MAG TPA: single-stranded DNA-binding protein [Porphyromonadaceae bacterium]|jgi:single-strand DNA-binding protein|nr:single-stranded DNA-binding protein [Porphyromonadaceae bacterium]